MHRDILIGDINLIKKQRNLFLLLTIILTLALLILSIAYGRLDQRIVMVPGLRQEVSVSKHSVSHSYLEEMSLVFLDNLLDLNANSIEYKKAQVLKYTAASDEKATRKIIEYFAAAKESYQAFDLNTFFTVKNMEIDVEGLKVIANGVLTSSYGKKGYDAKPMSYSLAFEFTGGMLRLKEFCKVIELDKDGNLKKEDQNLNLN